MTIFYPGFNDPDAQPVGSEGCDCGGLLNRNVILGLIVWLLLLTLLVLILLILMTKRSREYQYVRKEHGTRDGPWLETVPENHWKEYHVETISSPR